MPLPVSLLFSTGPGASTTGTFRSSHSFECRLHILSYLVCSSECEEISVCCSLYTSSTNLFLQSRFRGQIIHALTKTIIIYSSSTPGYLTEEITTLTLNSLSPVQKSSGKILLATHSSLLYLLLLLSHSLLLITLLTLLTLSITILYHLIAKIKILILILILILTLLRPHRPQTSPQTNPQTITAASIVIDRSQSGTF